MDEQAFSQIMSRLDRLENKIDKLMAFRHYVAGIGAACGLAGSYVLSLFRSY